MATFARGARVVLVSPQRWPESSPVPLGTRGTVGDHREARGQSFHLELFEVTWDTGASSLEPPGVLALLP